MLTNYSDLGNAKSVAPINRYNYTIHIHIVFSIDTYAIPCTIKFISDENNGVTVCMWLSRVSKHLDTDYRRAPFMSNRRHACAVAFRKSVNVIGHVPWKISAPCSLFIQRGGTLICIIIDSCPQIYHKAVYYVYGNNTGEI